VSELPEQWVRIPEEWRSKLADGVMPSVVLILTWMLVALAVRPVQQVFGEPGLMVYILGLLAVAMFALQASIQEKFSLTLRAWYGTAGGFLAWVVTELAIYPSPPVLTHPGGVILILMVAMIVYILWKEVFPPGVKFFWAVFLLNWAGHVVMNFHELFSYSSPVFMLTYRLTGVLSAVGALFSLAYILLYSSRRIERMIAAVLVWFLFSLAVYVFRGQLY
jgi:hypothetical protein